MLEMLARGGIVVRDHRQPARHRLERDVAEGLGGAGKEEDVGRRVVGGQLAVHEAAGNDVADIAAAQRETFTAEEGIVFVGKAQEKTSVFRTEKRKDLVRMLVGR